MAKSHFGLFAIVALGMAFGCQRRDVERERERNTPMTEPQRGSSPADTTQGSDTNRDMGRAAPGRDTSGTDTSGRTTSPGTGTDKPPGPGMGTGAGGRGGGTGPSGSDTSSGQRGSGSTGTGTGSSP